MKCWVLKTRENSPDRLSFTEYWDRFVVEGVIAIGWKLDIPLDKISYNEIVSALNRPYPARPREASSAAHQILKFKDAIAEGDNVLLCQGYAPNQIKNVHVYGIAQVTSPFYEDRNSDWWWYRHRANIQQIFGPNGIDVPRDDIASILGKGALLQTLHKIPCERFYRFVEACSKRQQG